MVKVTIPFAVRENGRNTFGRVFLPVRDVTGMEAPVVARERPGVTRWARGLSCRSHGGRTWTPFGTPPGQADGWSPEVTRAQSLLDALSRVVPCRDLSMRGDTWAELHHKRVAHRSFKNGSDLSDHPDAAPFLGSADCLLSVDGELHHRCLPPRLRLDVAARTDSRDLALTLNTYSDASMGLSYPLGEEERLTDLLRDLSFPVPERAPTSDIEVLDMGAMAFDAAKFSRTASATMALQVLSKVKLPKARPETVSTVLSLRAELNRQVRSSGPGTSSWLRAARFEDEGCSDAVPSLLDRVLEEPNWSILSDGIRELLQVAARDMGLMDAQDDALGVAP